MSQRKIYPPAREIPDRYQDTVEQDSPHRLRRSLPHDEPEAQPKQSVAQSVNEDWRVWEAQINEWRSKREQHVLFLQAWRVRHSTSHTEAEEARISASEGNKVVRQNPVRDSHGVQELNLSNFDLSSILRENKELFQDQGKDATRSRTTKSRK